MYLCHLMMLLHVTSSLQVLLGYKLFILILPLCYTSNYPTVCQEANVNHDVVKLTCTNTPLVYLRVWGRVEVRAVSLSAGRTADFRSCSERIRARALSLRVLHHRLSWHGSPSAGKRTSSARTSTAPWTSTSRNWLQMRECSSPEPCR